MLRTEVKMVDFRSKMTISYEINMSRCLQMAENIMNDPKNKGKSGLEALKTAWEA
jgi:hypothetical protein